MQVTLAQRRKTSPWPSSWFHWGKQREWRLLQAAGNPLQGSTQPRGQTGPTHGQSNGSLLFGHMTEWPLAHQGTQRLILAAILSACTEVQLRGKSQPLPPAPRPAAACPTPASSSPSPPGHLSIVVSHLAVCSTCPTLHLRGWGTGVGETSSLSKLSLSSLMLFPMIFLVTFLF